VPASAYVPMTVYETNYTEGVRLRYNYRLYPAPGQRSALARAFGCARVVFNDSLRARQDAYAAGLPYITDAELSARLTAAKATPERVWLGEVSAVVLQQAQADLNTSVHDAGWSAFTSMLEYKALKHGRTFARIGRFEPTSQVCSACGVKDGPKPLSVRTWTCVACGTVHDRDVNAARNILALGRADRLNACGGEVRPGPAPAVAGEAGSLRGAA